MKHLILFMVLAAAVVGCDGAQRDVDVAEVPTTPPGVERVEPAAPPTIDDYALLHDLMKNQQRVSGALIIPFKKISGETRTLIKEIADASQAARKQLEDFADASPVVQIKELPLTAAEIEARKSEEKLVSQRIMSARGVEFERELLKSQVQAITDATRLAREIAAKELDPQRRQWLGDFAESYGALYNRVQERLDALPQP